MKKGDAFVHEYDVSQEVYRGFISTFKDENALHVDANYARQKGFKDVVVQGNVLNGFLSFFVGECLPIKNVIIHSQSISYVSPVYVNDTLTLTSTVEDVFESVNAVEFKYKFTNQTQDLIAKGRLQIGILP